MLKHFHIIAMTIIIKGYFSNYNMVFIDFISIKYYFSSFMLNFDIIVTRIIIFCYLNF